DERTRSFLKIQDGCDYWCAYCTIPGARGRSRNAPIAEIVDNARLIAGKGIKEIVLTGVNIGDFGKSTRESFIELLYALDQLDGVERYRISSVEPNLLTDEIIRFVADSAKFAPHFHIPLQGGADQILKMMGRRYDTRFFAGRIDQINDIFKRASIGIDVIVGFPGETDELFEESYRFLERLDFSYLHVFNYSKRPATRAEKMKGHLPPTVREQRSKLLIELSNQKKRNFYKKNIGTSQSVIFEDRLSDGYMFGFTGNYINVRASYDQRRVNALSQVKLSEPDEEFNWLNSTLF
ncbi:MAG: MiaB/RimO family radical SAM methylthiotransferase, partial [Bacteroidota bacterium]